MRVNETSARLYCKPDCNHVPPMPPHPLTSSRQAHHVHTMARAGHQPRRLGVARRSVVVGLVMSCVDAPAAPWLRADPGGGFNRRGGLALVGGPYLRTETSKTAPSHPPDPAQAPIQEPDRAVVPSLRCPCQWNPLFQVEGVVACPLCGKPWLPVTQPEPML
jgi:hypothetical protein